MAPSGLRVVLAEDAVLLREGLVELLGRFGHRVVAAVSDADALIAAVDEHEPDIVVTDVRMPPGFTDEGVRAAIALRAADPDRSVLVLTQYVAPAYAFELLESHNGRGVGYLLKHRVGAVRDFVAAVERVARGETVIDHEVVRQLLRRERADRPLSKLTERENEVLALMAEGRTNAAIAGTLHISQAAVAKNIGSIFLKLGISGVDGNHRVLAVLTYMRG